MLIFFGDPETRGDRGRPGLPADGMEHATPPAELNAKWRAAGIEHPFQVRMGINSGYCNVGNFGSADRMDYTIIGAEANLAARLQSIAEPGSIVISYETFALVSDVITAHPLPAITMKGISREVIPYSVDNLLDDTAKGDVIVERVKGLDFYLDPSLVDPQGVDRIRSILSDALAMLDKTRAKPAQ